MSDTVTLTFAARTNNASLARTVAATMSARADLPLDQLEDVRLAVDEAVTQSILDLGLRPHGLGFSARYEHVQLDGPVSTGRRGGGDGQ
jgi:hypothetical protein